MGWQPLNFVTLHLCHMRRVTLRSVRSKRSYRKRSELGLVGCFGHCCFFAQWRQEDLLDLIWGRDPSGHPGECVCPSQLQPFMSVCFASPALGLTLEKSVSSSWGPHLCFWQVFSRADIRIRSPVLLTRWLRSKDMVMDTRGTGVTA